MHKSIKRAFARRRSSTPNGSGKEMSEVNSFAVPPAKIYQDIRQEKQNASSLSDYSWCSSKASFSSDTTLGDFEPLGLQLLYPSAQQLKTQSFEYASSVDEIDIVAIHDLGGPYHSSWTHKNGTLWLRDLLPDAFPRARIFSYGWRPEAFFADFELGLRACADELLEALSMARGEKWLERPIIFICHGLGGIICKQALLTASCQSGVTTVVAATRGIVFLGTPHRQFPYHRSAAIFAEILPLGVYMSETKCIFASRKDMLQDALRTKVSMIQDINSSFKDAKLEVEIITFYDESCELQGISMPSCISSKKFRVMSHSPDMASAIIGVKKEDYLPLDINYLEIGHCFGETDPSFRFLIHSLWKIATAKARPCQNVTPTTTLARPQPSKSTYCDLAISVGEELYDHCKLSQDEVNERYGIKCQESMRRQVAKQILVATGQGHKKVPHLPIPHLPVPTVPIPNITSALRKPKLKLHRPNLHNLKLHKPEMKLPKTKLRFHGPKPFRYADSFDSEYSVNRTYTRHHSPNFVRAKAPTTSQSVHSHSEKGGESAGKTAVIPSPESLPAGSNIEGSGSSLDAESIDSQDPFDSNDQDCEESSDSSYCDHLE